MKARTKRTIISIVMLFVMLIQEVCMGNTIQASEADSIPETATSTDASNDLEANKDDLFDIDMEAQDSFADLISNELQNVYTEQQENNGNNIFNVEITDNIAYVEFEVIDEASLVVGIYDETEEQLFATGSIEVQSDMSETYVEIDDEDMPQYFIVKAYLIDSDTMAPLCTEYKTDMYTQEMQELLAKTIYDFEDERVVNFDSNDSNNFAVYSDETLILNENSVVNYIVSADEINNTYVIENADDSLKNLGPDDIFSYEYEDGTILIVKIESITIEGTTVTIIGQDTSLEEVFDYVKIDSTADVSQAEIDNTNLPEGVEFEGIVEEESGDIETYAIDAEAKKSISAKYSFLDVKLVNEDNKSSEVSGNVELKMENSVKVYISSKKKYIEFKMKYNLGINFEVEAKIKGSVPLGEYKFRPIPVLALKFTPSVIAEVNVKATIEGSLEGTVGLSASAQDGITILTSKPKFKSKLELEGTVFIGLGVEPGIEVVNDNVLEVTVNAKLGGEIKAKLSADTDSKVKMHGCKGCLDGEVSAKVECTFKAKFFNKLTFAKKLSGTYKLFDFYYSFDYKEFGYTECPHIKFKTTVIVKDSDGNLIDNAKVTCDWTRYYTNENGIAVIYLKHGKHNISVSKPGIGDASKKITISENAKKLLFILDDNGGKVLEDGEIPCIFSKVSLGRWHSGALTVDGDLYVWGSDNNAQVGDSICQGGIVKIDDVVDFDLEEDHNAAITSEGNLYTWGESGQVGYDEKKSSYGRRRYPSKILSNIKSVDLGSFTNVAVSNDGKLYIWGEADEENYDKRRSDAFVAMTNVKDAAAGGFSWGIIKNDGYLYLSNARNSYPLSNPYKSVNNIKKLAMGDGGIAVITNDDELYFVSCEEEPRRIMGNVKDVAVGRDHYAAITKNGELYMWGSNEYGQIGDGTTINRSVPVKVLDNVISVDVGESHTGAVTQGGNLYLWGNNSERQVNDSWDCRSYTTPQLVTYKEPETVDMVTDSMYIADSYDSEGYILPTDITQSETGYIISFEGLQSEDIYNCYAMQSRNAYDVFGDDNLEYLTQIVPDENGNVEVKFNTGKDISCLDIFLAGQNKIPITDVEVSMEDLLFTGEVKAPITEVKLGEEVLTEGIDYEIEGDYLVSEVGQYTVIIRGIGKYSGAKCVDFEIILPKVFVEQLKLQEEDATLDVGDKKELSVLMTPENATDISVNWVSEDSNIADVDSSGVVEAIGPGKTVITVSTKDGSDLSASCTISVYTQFDKPSAPAIQTMSVDRVVLKERQGCEYSKDGVTWQSSCEFDKLKSDTEYTFYIRKRASGYYKASDKSDGLKVRTNKASTEDSTQEPEVVPDVTVSYRTHVQSFGWQNYVTNGKLSGTSGKAKRLEGINIKVVGNKNLGIQYTTHCQSYGWLPWSANDEMNGTQGEAKRLEAIMIQLTGADKDKYDVYYRVHAQSYGWLGWAKNGAPAGTAGYAKRLEAIQIVVVKKGEKAPGLDYADVKASAGVHNASAYVAKAGTSPVVGAAATSAENPSIPGTDTTNVTYRTHVQSFGWQGWKYNGQMSGTSGMAKRLEGIEIKLTNKQYSGSIVYTTHVQSYGWQGDVNKPSTWKQEGQMAGTSGEAKRLEAICIKLTGEMEKHYDVYYRVHAQSYGWLGWAKNGECSGTAGYGKRLEGIQVVLVPKGGSAPADNYGGVKANRTEAYIAK